MANPLFRTKNNVGEGMVDASSMPAWKSPSDAAPVNVASLVATTEDTAPQ